MKEKDNAIKTSAYIAPIIVVFASLLLVLFVALSLLGVINPRETKLIIKTADATKIYNGEPLSAMEYEISYGKLLSKHTAEAISSTELTKVGVAENVVTLLIKDETGADVTRSYDIEYEYGMLEVTPKQITVSTPNIYKYYDALPLENEKYNLNKGLVKGHEVQVTIPFSRTDVGVYENEIDVIIVDEKGGDVTDQYELTYKYGNAEIRGRLITISTGSKDSLYTGSAVFNKSWTHESGALFEGDKMTVVCNASLTEVGKIENIPRVTVVNKYGTDVTQNYEFAILAGTLEVKPIAITIKTGSAMKIYDGTPISNTKWSVSGGGLIKGDSISVVSYPSLQNVGIISNDIVFSVKDSKGVDVTSRYKITCIEGNLSVQPRPISVLTSSARKSYDGEPLMANDYRIVDGSLCTGHKATFVGSQQTEIGYTQNIPTRFEIYSAGANGVKVDESLNYLITYTYGTLTVIN